MNIYYWALLGSLFFAITVGECQEKAFSDIEAVARSTKVEELEEGLRPFLDSEDPDIRSHAYGALLSRVGDADADTPTDRQKIVDVLAERLQKEKGRELEHAFLNYLSDIKYIKSADFSDKSKRSLEVYLKEVPEKAITKGHLVLAEKIGSDTFAAYTEKLSTEEWKDPETGMWFGSVQWQALVSRASAGDDVAAAKLVSVYNSEKDIAQRLRAAKDLALTQHPLALRELSSMLMSDEKFPSSRGDGHEGPPLSWRVALVMEEHVVGFPQRGGHKGQRFTVDEIETAREWVRQQNWYREE